MASRTLSPFSRRSFGLQEKQLSFRILANGAWTSPVIAGGRGSNATISGVGNAVGVASVVRTSAGKFTITLDDAYAKLCSAQCSFSCSGDAVDIYAQMGAITGLGTSTPLTVVVKTKTGATNTDPTTFDSDTHIDVDLVFEDSGA